MNSRMPTGWTTVRVTVGPQSVSLDGILVCVSADIGFCPPVAMNDCPLTAIRPLSVIGKRTFASAAYRHIGDTSFRGAAAA